MATGCLATLVDQTWHYDKVDETLLEQVLLEIRKSENLRLESLREAKEQEIRGAYEPHFPGFVRLGAFKTDGLQLTHPEEAGDSNLCTDEIETAPIQDREPWADTYLLEDLWRNIFSRLEVESLPQIACVCRGWRKLVKDDNLWAQAFITSWGLAGVSGEPSSTGFWRGKLSQFAISHDLERGDSIASLAVKYNVQVMDIRRQNMMMSDHGIHSRDRLLIPVTKKEFVEGKECFVETDPYARREVAVLYLDGGGQNRKPTAAIQRARLKAAHKLKHKVMESLKRSLRVDDGTAAYYLETAGGDVRGAYSEFLEDVEWEKRQRGGGGRGGGGGGGRGRGRR